jgi:hypothetical protein
MSQDAIQTTSTITRPKSTIEKIPLSDLRTHEMIEVLAIWHAHRHGREMPSRNDLVPRAIGRYLRNVSLLRVLQLERDYEFRIVGDAHIEAYGARNQGKRVSELMLDAPAFAELLKASLDLVVRKRAPIAYRGVFAREDDKTRFSQLETLYAPMASTDGSVDYILNACVYDMRSGARSAPSSLGAC